MQRKTTQNFSRLLLRDCCLILFQYSKETLNDPHRSNCRENPEFFSLSPYTPTSSNNQRGTESMNALDTKGVGHGGKLRGARLCQHQSRSRTPRKRLKSKPSGGLQPSPGEILDPPPFYCPLLRYENSPQTVSPSTESKTRY